MRIILAVIFAVIFYSSTCYSEESHKLDRIVVTPSRLISESIYNSRSLTVLDDSAISMSAYTALADIIGNIGNIDLRRRGPEGVQSDISIRGANFEQNTVLIDGVKVNDPQTGHYNMDIPLTSADIESVEILRGPASSIYGANSFGGLINIITRKPEGPKVLIDASGGSFDYFNTLLSATIPLWKITNRFSIEESRSGGYMPETEFNILSLSDTASLKTGFGDLDFIFGYMKKDFGADSFYSNLFPNEEEHTDTRFFKLSGRLEFGDLEFRPNLFLRRHWDKFALDRNRPGWQTNYHTNYNYGGELNFILHNDFMDTAYGFELSRDTIDSTNLQTHQRTRDGIYIELSPHISEKLDLKIGAREDRFSDFGWEFSPSVNAAYNIFEYMSVRGLVGRSYRIPTFTDLYYNDSANNGNPSLAAESSWTYEAGIDCNYKLVSASLTYFYRQSQDTIDWTRLNLTQRWQASNIGTVDTNGVEFSLRAKRFEICRNAAVTQLFFEYTALDSYRKHDYLSKYALDYLKHHITSGLEYELFGFKNSWVLNYKKRVGSPGAFIADAKLSKNIIKKDRLDFNVFIEATNLFDEDYSEQSGIPMPGRWIKSGARIEF